MVSDLSFLPCTIIFASPDYARRHKRRRKDDLILQWSDFYATPFLYFTLYTNYLQNNIRMYIINSGLFGSMISTTEVFDTKQD